MKVDILYSITAHEAPDSFADTIKNIKYFNKGHRIAIVVNANPAMHASIIEDDIVRVLPNPWCKQLHSKDIFVAHMQNYKYSKDNGISASYFIMLASNCMFHRQITLNEIENMADSAPPCDVKTQKEKQTGWHWPTFYLNRKLLSILADKEVHSFIASQHEGMILPSCIMDSIYIFSINNALADNITNNSVFEEILPGSLYAYFTDKMPAHICKIFWERPGYSPSKEDILSCTLPCVKRVNRNMQDPVRQWLRSLRISP